MGELAEALRRANDAAESPDRPTRSTGTGEASARTLSLDEVLGNRRGSQARVEESTAEAAIPTSDKLQAGPPPGPAPNAMQSISRETGLARAERISFLDTTATGAACARRIAQKVKRRAAQREIRSIVVTSSLRGEGKTTTACNLAIALTRLDRSESVVLVDLDLRRPSIARSLGLKPVRTVNDVLERRATLDEALLVTDVPGLTVLATDRGIATPEPLLSSQNLRSLIELLERRFSRVIIDTPPALVVSDASSVIDAADGYIFVASAGSTPTKSVRGALDHLPREKVLGCVLNYARDAKAIPTDYYAYTELGEQSERDPAREGTAEEHQ